MQLAKNFTNIAFSKGGSNNITYLDELYLQYIVTFEEQASIVFLLIIGSKNYTRGVYSSPLRSSLPW